MSNKTVDERVVEMRFDNKNFEKNVQETMSTLDKLKAKLKLDGVSKGLDEVSKSASKIDVSPLSKSIETVQARFSALEVIGVTALMNITNSAINAGKRIVSALTIDPIKTGYQEYELKMGSIQTIMAGTGESLDTVNQYLQELNEYSDRTIYSFSDMTSNIGKFTNAGVKLEDAVMAIKGVSNVAAISGANANEASRAMYNFSQALSAGYVKLIDWKSIENANMATVEFKNELIKTALELGTVVEKGDLYQSTTTDLTGKVSEAFDSTKMFNDSLSAQWMTTEVLVETLKRYTDETTELGKKAYSSAQDIKTFSQLFDTLKEAAQSGWSETWEIMVGDFEEAKVLLTEISTFVGGIIDGMSDSRNALLGGAMNSKWKKLSKQIASVGLDVEDFKEELINTAKKHGIAIDEMIEKEGSFEKTLKSGWLSSDLITETFKTMSANSKELGTSTEELTKKFNSLKSIVHDVMIGEYGNGQARVEALTAAGYDYGEVQGWVNKVVEGHQLTLEDLSDTQLESLGYTEEQIAALKELAKQAEETGTPLNELISDMSSMSGRELVIDTFRNAIKGFTRVCKTAGLAWREVFPKYTSEQLYGLIERIHDLSSNLLVSDQNAAKLKITFKGLFSAIHLITTVTGGGLRIGLSLLNIILEALDMNVLDLTAGLGSAIIKFEQWVTQNQFIKNSIQGVVTWITTAIGKVKDFISSFSGLSNVSFNLSSIKTISSDIGKIFSDFIKDFKEMDKFSLDGFIEAFKSFKDGVKEYIGDNAGGLYDGLQNGLISFNEAIAPHLVSAGLSITSFNDKLKTFSDFLNKTFFENIGVAELMTVGLGIGVVQFSKTLGKSITSITGFMDGFSGIATNFGKVLGNTAGAISQFTRLIKWAVLIEAAVAIAILAGSLWLLAKIPAKELMVAAGAITVAAAGLAALVWAMSLLEKTDGASKVGIAFISIAVSIGILVLALKAMEQLDPEKIWTTLTVLGVLAVGMSALMFIISKMKGDFTIGFLPLIGVAIALKILVGVVSDLAEIVNNESASIERAFGGLLLLLVGLFGILKAASVLSKASWGAAAAILASVIAFKMMIGLFDDITNLDLSKIGASLGKLVVLLGIYSLVLVTSKLAGQHAAGAGGMLISMAISLGIIVMVLKLLELVNPSTIERGLFVVSGMMLIFGVVAALSKFAGEHALRAGGMIMMMAGSLTILVMVMMILGKMNEDELGQALGALTGIAFIIGALIAVSKLAGDGAVDTIANLIKAIGVLAISVGLLALIARNDTESLKTAAGVMVAVIAAFSVLMVASKYMKTFSKSAAKSIVIMAAVVAGLTLVVWLLSKIEFDDTTMNTVVSLGILLLAFSASLAIIGSIGRMSKTAISAMLPMIGVIAGLALILAALSALTKDMDNVLEVSLGLSALLLALSVSMAIMAASSALIAGASVALLPMIGMVVLVGALIAALYTIQKEYPDLNDMIHKTIPLLSDLGYALGAMVGGAFAGIIGSFMDIITTKLPLLGLGLSNFMINATPFIMGLKLIDKDTISSAESMANTVLALSRAAGKEAWNDLFSLFGLNGWDSLKDNMILFAEAVIGYSQKIKENEQYIDSDLINESAKAGESLVGVVNNMPKSDGLLQKIMGSSDMKKFSKGLTYFGDAIVSYHDSISSLPEGGTAAIENSIEAAKALCEVGDNIPNSGGWIENIFGAKNSRKFKRNITSFGETIVTYSESVRNLTDDDIEAIKNSAAAGKQLTALAEGLPSSGGKFQECFGGSDLGTFSNNLSTFGDAISTYAEKVKGMSSEEMSNSNTIISGLIDTIVKLINTGGFDILVENGEYLKTFGNAFRAYYNEISVMDPSLISAISLELDQLADVVGKLGKFTDDLKALGEFSVSKFLEVFDNSHDKVLLAGINMFNKLIEGFNAKKTSVETTVASITDSLITTIEDREDNFKIAANTLISAFTNAFKSGEKSFKDAAKTVVQYIYDEFSNSYSEMYSYGYNINQGLADGITDYSYISKLKAKTMANLVLNTIKDTLDINSPSKETYKLGEFTALGLANALSDNASLVGDEASSMGNSLLDKLNATMSMVYSIFDSDVDMQPTIVPVMDLTNVQNGVGAINGMLSSNRYITVSNATLDNLQANASINGSSGLGQYIGELKSDISDLAREIKNFSNGDMVNNISAKMDNLINAVSSEKYLNVNGKALARTLASDVNIELEKINVRGKR